MKYIIDCGTPPELTFTPSSKAAEVLQNIWIILNTPKCSVPGYPEFGIDMNYQHAPVSAAATMFAVAVNDAIKAFEPRAKLENATFKNDTDGVKAGTLNPILEVSINE